MAPLGLQHDDLAILHRALADHLAAAHPDARATNALFGGLDNPEMVAALRALASDGPRLFPGEPESDEGQ